MSMSENTAMRNLINKFRLCKTAAEERDLINKTRSQIRNTIKNLSLESKADSILKLIWMNMNGHETEFAQVECMNVLFYENFRTKLIGYLGLTLFLNEKSEVLMMTTDRIRRDLENKDNYFIVALALKTFSEIADKNMTIDLFQYIMELLETDSKYIKKKAILACIRVLQKQPNLVNELEQILPYILKEKNHGLLICSLHLAKICIKLKPEFKKCFNKSLDNLYIVLENLQKDDSINYSIDKINDPMLQCTILSFIKELAITDEKIADEFGSQILMVYNNIKNSNSAPAFCLLYECARCIMQINSSIALKKVGISILGKFLEMQHSNFLYLSLRMLYYVSGRYKEEVAKYDDLIQKCVKNEDFNIKKLSINILKNIVSKENVDKIFGLILK